MLIALQKLKNNLLFAILIATIFIVAEESYRIYEEFLTYNLTLHKVGVYFLVGIIVSFLKSQKAIERIFYIFILFNFIELLHFQYYKTWIFPLEYLLFFTNFNEVMATFISVSSIIVVPTIITLFLFFGLKLVFENTKDCVKLPYMGVVLIVFFMIFLPARVYFDKDTRHGEKPNVEVSPILNSIDTLGYLFGRIIPDQILHKSKLQQKLISPLNITKRNPDINVVVIMGESLTANAMSLFNGFKDTTPKLNSLKNDTHFFYKKAFSSGSMTDVSLPSFFNIVYQPDATGQVISANTCLFKMAKNNGFTTYFYTAQSKGGLSEIRSYLCPKSIDFYSDSSEVTHDIKQATYDNFLLRKLNMVNLEQPTFIVLHQYGSHSVYKERYPKDFEYFEPTSSLNQYKNSIRYTDYIITSIIKTLKEKSHKPTYIFFVSDHGEGINRYSGHGNLNDPNQYEVPFIYYVINDNMNTDELNKYIGEYKFTSHFKIANLIAHKLGYDTAPLKTIDGYNDAKFIVCGQHLSGIAGYLKITLDKNGSIHRSIEY